MPIKLITKRCVLLFYTLLLSLAWSISSAESHAKLFDNKIENLQHRVSDIKSDIRYLKKQRKSRQGNAAAVQRIQSRIERKKNRLEALRIKLAEYQQQSRHHARLMRQGWTLKYRDEFNGNAVNDQKWRFEQNCWGGGNNEQQCYTSRPENAEVSKGQLRIIAKEESFSGPGVPDDDPNYSPSDQSRTLPFTSARLRSKGLIDFKYGRVEVRAKATGGQGMWPAIWMLPTDNVYGGWPSSGEIDIMEAVNLGVWPNEVHGTLHYGLLWPQWANNGQSQAMNTNPADNFHVYAIEWEADEIRWYIDGEHYQTQRSEGWYNYVWKGQNQGFDVANPRAPFDQKFHLIMNLAVGGSWPGAPDTGWVEDRELLVDYVRVYQCGKRADNQGCATVDPLVEVNADVGAPGVNSFTIYGNGPEIINLDDNGQAFPNTVELGYWELNQGSLYQGQVDLGNERGLVWQVDFGGLSNVFISAENMSSNPAYESGIQFSGGSGWTNNGVIAFDMLVESAASDSKLTVKLDSGWPHQGQVDIDIPGAGQWHTVAVRLSDLLNSPNPSGGGVDLSHVANLFVLEYAGTQASVKLDNIRVACAVNEQSQSWQMDQVCGLSAIKSSPQPITDQHDVYVDSVTDWEPFDCCGGAQITEIQDNGNPVLSFNYDSDPNTNTVTFFGLPSNRNMTHYTGGTLEFDMLVTQQPTNPATVPWLFKVDCNGGNGCSTGDTPITASVEGVNPSAGVWQHYTIEVDELVSRGLDLGRVSAIVVWPSWGNQDNAAYLLDNVVWKVAD